MIIPDIAGRYCLIISRCLCGGMTLSECSCLIDDLAGVIFEGGRAEA